MTSISEGHVQSEDDLVELRIVDKNIAIRKWIEYTFDSQFLTPTDGWSFTLGAETFGESLKNSVVPGAKVQLAVNGVVLSTGYIDSVEKHASKDSGTEWVIEGRDVMAFAVDGCIDPTLRFKPTMNLSDVLIGALGPFGWSSEGAFAINDEYDGNVLTAQIRGQKRTKVRVSKRGKVSGGKPLKKYGVDQLRPQNGEGAFRFAARIAERHGLWIWPSADGEKLIVDRPDNEGIQPEHIKYNLYRREQGSGKSVANIQSGGAKWDFTDQPTAIIADGAGSGGGTFGYSPIRARMVNPITGVDSQGFLLDSVSQAFAKFPTAQEVVHEGYPKVSAFVPTGINRVLFMHDDESHTQDQLEGFIRREMSLRLRKALVGNYVVQGHTQKVDDWSIPWTVGTYVNVDDDVSDVHEVMWVEGRTLHKNRNGGTFTSLKLIRTNTLEF